MPDYFLEPGWGEAIGTGFESLADKFYKSLEYQLARRNLQERLKQGEFERQMEMMRTMLAQQETEKQRKEQLALAEAAAQEKTKKEKSIKEGLKKWKAGEELTEEDIYALGLTPLQYEQLKQAKITTKALEETGAKPGTKSTIVYQTGGGKGGAGGGRVGDSKYWYGQIIKIKNTLQKEGTDTPNYHYFELLAAARTPEDAEAIYNNSLPYFEETSGYDNKATFDELYKAMASYLAAGGKVVPDFRKIKFGPSPEAGGGTEYDKWKKEMGL